MYITSLTSLGRTCKRRDRELEPFRRCNSLAMVRPPNFERLVATILNDSGLRVAPAAALQPLASPLSELQGLILWQGMNKVLREWAVRA